MGSPSQTYPKAERLRRRGEFLAVQQAGRKIHTRSFVIFLLDAAQAKRAAGIDGGSTRFGVTASKKVGDAVTRNRVKRVVREIYRRNKPRFPAAMDVVVMAKAEAAGLGYADAERELLAGLGRVRP